MEWQAKKSELELTNAGRQFTANSGVTADLMNDIVQLQHYLKEADQHGNVAAKT